MSTKRLEAPAQAASAEITRCEGIGNIMVCLHYLSCQAYAMNSPDLVRAIDRAVQDVMEIGLDAYNCYLQEVLRSRGANGAGFVEDFCKVSDEVAKGELREIARGRPRYAKRGN